jgi:hypothetical protein
MKAETVIEGAKLIAIGAAAYFAYRAVSSGAKTVTGFYQKVTDAVGVAVDVVSHPVEVAGDIFGIMPRQDEYGRTKWSPTTPWENKNDPVSNNDLGVNFNYF